MLTTCTTRAEWLRERAQGEHPIGSSDVPRILGTSPYGGPWSVWRDRFQPDMAEEDDGDHLDAGLRDEPRALAWYAWTFRDLDVDHQPWRIARRTDAPWMTCSPDALVAESGRSVYAGGVEIKHLDHEDLSQWAPSGAEWHAGQAPICPRFIMQQAMWCAIVCDVPWWDIIAALGTGGRYPDTRVYRVHRSDATTRWMVDRVSAWRQRHLVEGIEPPFDVPEERLQSVQHRYPRPDEPARVIDADQETEQLLAQLGEAKAQRERWEAAETDLRAQVCEAIGTAKTLRSRAWSATWSVPSSTRSLAGLRRIEAEHPELAAQLERAGLITTATTARRLTLRARSNP